MQASSRAWIRSAGLWAPVWIAAIAGSCGGGGGGSTSPPGTSETVTVASDVYGVPHVFASTDAGALFGAGYAAAQQRLFEMCWTRLMYQGRVAEFFGPGTVLDPQGHPVDKNLVHDRKARLIGWARFASKVVAGIDADTLALLQAYADGVNAYMGAPTGPLHPFFAQYAVPLDPWTPRDCVGVWMRLARHFGSEGLEEAKQLHDWQQILQIPGLTFEERLELLLGPRVCDDTAAAIQQVDVPPLAQQAMQDYASQHGLSIGTGCQPVEASPHFSQAWVVAGSHTTTGRAVLVGDPRLEVFSPSMLFEWSMQGASFAVRGVGVPGSPNLLSGSSASMAWSPTALGLDQADLFQLSVDPIGHPGLYRLDGTWVPYLVDEPDVIHVLGAADVTLTYRETVWGPVVTAVTPNALGGEEFALRRVPFDDSTRDPAQGFFALNRAGDAASFLAALDGWTWPAVNLLFADSQGHIGYSVVGSVPIRNPQLVLPGIIAQDGALSSSDWIELLPQPLKPQVVDPSSGFLVSANQRPVGSWYPIPVRFGSGTAGDTHNSLRIRELLSSGPQQLTPAEVRDLHHDVVNPARRDLVELGLWLRDAQSTFTLSSSAGRSLGELEPWWQQGARTDSDLRGVALAWLIPTDFRDDSAGKVLVARYGGGENGLMHFLKRKVADIRAVPPVPLDADEFAFVDKVLADAWASAQAIGPPGTWLAWYQNTVLPVFQTPWTSLEGLPSLEPGTTLGYGTPRTVDVHTLLSPTGQSYTQFVEPGSGDTALSASPPGAAEQAPHALDQLPLWLGEDFKASPLTLAGVQAMGPSTSVVLHYGAPRSGP
jgi:penicillin G amidase